MIQEWLEVAKELGRPISESKGASALKYSLDELLDGITPDNLHDEIDTGEAVGQEIGEVPMTCVPTLLKAQQKLEPCYPDVAKY